MNFVFILQVPILSFLVCGIWSWDGKGNLKPGPVFPRGPIDCLWWFALEFLLITSEPPNWNSKSVCGTHTILTDLGLSLDFILYLPYDFSHTSSNLSQSSSSFLVLQYPRLSHGLLNPSPLSIPSACSGQQSSSTMSKTAGSSLYHQIMISFSSVCCCCGCCLFYFQWSDLKHLEETI